MSLRIIETGYDRSARSPSPPQWLRFSPVRDHHHHIAVATGIDDALRS